MEYTFGELLRELRRNAGLTQRDLAAKAKLDFSYISKLENNRIPPPAADTVVNLCRILGTAPDQLLALIGKIPSKVHQMISSTPAAQSFLREAQKQSLSDEQWKKLTDILNEIKEL